MLESRDRQSVVKSKLEQALGVHLRPEFELGLEGARELSVHLCQQLTTTITTAPENPTPSVASAGTCAYVAYTDKHIKKSFKNWFRIKRMFSHEKGQRFFKTHVSS